MKVKIGKIVSFLGSSPAHVPHLFAGHPAQNTGLTIGEPIGGADQPVPRRGSLSVATGFNPWKRACTQLSETTLKGSTNDNTHVGGPLQGPDRFMDSSSMG